MYSTLQHFKVSLLPRSIMKIRAIHQLMLCSVKTKPGEFSSSNRNVKYRKLWFKFISFSTGAYKKEGSSNLYSKLDHRTEILLQQTSVAVCYEVQCRNSLWYLTSFPLNHWQHGLDMKSSPTLLQYRLNLEEEPSHTNFIWQFLLAKSNNPSKVTTHRK